MGRSFCRLPCNRDRSRLVARTLPDSSGLDPDRCFAAPVGAGWLAKRRDRSALDSVAGVMRLFRRVRGGLMFPTAHIIV